MYNCVGFIEPRWSPAIVLILPWPFYLVCLFAVMAPLSRHLMIRLGGWGDGGGARLCHVGWAFYQVPCPRGAAMLSALKPPAQWSPVGQQWRAALPRVQQDKEPPPLIKGPEYAHHVLTALTEGKWQQEEGRSWGGGSEAGVVRPPAAKELRRHQKHPEELQ